MWWGGTTPSAATILQMTWTPSTPGGLPGAWSCPRVFKRFDDLGLRANEDLDALAVDLVNQRILFSTKTRARDELLFVYCGTDGAVTPKTLWNDATNDKVEYDVGLFGDDDLDGVCGIDPSVRASQSGAFNILHFYAATPMATLLPPSNRLQASCFKINLATGPAIRSQLVGWPPHTGVGAGWAACFFAPPNMLGPLIPLLGEMRDVTPVFCGDPRVMTLSVPANKTLMHFEFDLRWFVIDAAATEIQDAHPLRIRL
jgi:hypothetical protein